MPLPALETPQSPPDPNKPAERVALGDQGEGQEGRKEAEGGRKSDGGADGSIEPQAPTPASEPNHDNAVGAAGAPNPDPPPSPPDQAANELSEDMGEIAEDTIGPMDTILHMGPPPSSGTPSVSFAPESAESDPPRDLGSRHKFGTHLHPPPYVHHFDSYSLVKQLSSGGYTTNQSITSMKAVRGLLAANLDVAQSELVSKSDVENETYLFRAACSELSTEVRNNRRVADEQLRQQRTLLQHEVDILTQHLNQELLTLTDSVRGMFNDRRMAVREEQKAVDSRVND